MRIKENKKKLIIFIIAILCVIAGFFVFQYFTKTGNDVCKTISFTAPLAEEINYFNEISQDTFVQYLRRALDDYLSANYTSCTETKCEYRGLYQGIHYADSAYSSEELGSISRDYLKSKFIILGTDIALGGGQSIILMFKDKPDKIFSAWVYEYSENEYDLREFSEYELEEGEPTILETQKTFINQICDKNMGI